MGAEEQRGKALSDTKSRSNDERQVSPERDASFFTKLTWGWAWQLLWKGNSQSIQMNDIYKIQPELSMEQKYQQFQRNLGKIQEGEYFTGEEVFKALYKTVQMRFWVSCLLLVASETVSVTSTLVAKEFIQYAESLYNNESVSVVRGVTMALGIGIMTLTGSFFNNHFQYQIKRVVLIVSGILNLAVFNKVAMLSPDARLKFPTSDAITLTSVSLGLITGMVKEINYIISFPIVLGLSTAILANNLRVAVIPGLAVIGCGIAFNMLVVKYIKGLSIEGLGQTAKRIGMIQEDLNSIKAIKLHNWEQMHLSAIKEVRKREVSIFRDMKIKGYIFEIVVMLVPELAGVVSFATMVHIGSHVSAAQWFPSLSLFGILLPTVSSCSNAVATIGSGKAAYRKFTKFFNLENAKPYLIHDDELEDNVAIKLSDASVTWTTPNGQVDGLANMNLSVQRGELIFVVGKVGAGKSRLVSAMAGIGSGVSGNFRYGSLTVGATIDQWIAPTTLEENILFGEDMDEKRLNNVLKACELLPDVDTLPNRLKTYIGKGGTTLSGGQKARVAMARTCYTSNDVVIFDDILSAVDTGVAKSIVENCICGFLAGRTRIVTTHQLEYLHRADRILFIDSMHGVHLEKLSALKESNAEFASFVSSAFAANDEPLEKSALVESSTSVSEVEEANPNSETQVETIREEKKLDGRVPLSLYNSYVAYGGGYIAGMGCVVLIVLHSGCYAMAPVWLSFWSSDKFNLGVNSSIYISLYLAFILLWGVLLWAFNTAVISMGLNGSQKLSFDGFDGVFNASFKFFDKTPTGRILTRFSDDLINLDLALPVYFGVVLRCFFLTLATMVPVFVYLPFSTLALIPLLIFFVGFSFFYKRSFREVQRCSSLFVAKSTGALVDSVSGIETIILARNVGGALKNIQTAMDDTIMSKTLVNAYNGWLGVRLDFAGLFVALTVSLMCVFKSFKLTSSTVGLLLSMVPSVVSALTYLVQYISELEQNMNSVERLEEYARLNSSEESRAITNTTELDLSESEIRFDKVSLSYGGPDILKEVSFTIYPHQRLGICGRSGAGKSSIIAVLLRAYEFQGEILVGETSLRDISANKLRNLISVIPQDPILLEGTVRKNIDPEGLKADVDIWNLLKRCCLYERENFRLDSVVEKGGLNYSAGERQLLILLRALALERKFLIMDEATSNLDYEMQQLIQNILKREAPDCTVLTVAHRIQTIVDYERVLVVDNGHVVDDGTPKQLYDDGGDFLRAKQKRGNNT